MGATVIERLVQLLAGGELDPGRRADDLQIAVAALLVEAARMDDRFDAAERAAIHRLLADRFDLSLEATRELLAAAEAAVARSAQLFRFTDMVIRRLEPEQRVAIIEMLWEVAYADGRLDPEEDALLRRIGGLIGVSDQDRMRARRRARQRLGLGEPA
jgi:uncharacterized tellurite resistance protein B-like protein